MLNIVEKVDDAVSIRNVLISVSDKSGLEDFVRGLCDACPGVTFYSTGGTFAESKKFWGKVRRNSNRFPTTRDSRRCKADWLKPLISKFTPDF